MTLAWRLLLLTLLLNLAVVGAVQVVAFYGQERLLQQQQGNFVDSELTEFLGSVYSAEGLYSAERMAGDARQVRHLVGTAETRELFSDVIVTSGRPPFRGLVYLNPHGAVHRDPERFPQELILDGMERARDHVGLVAVAGGFCKAIRNEREVVGSMWFVPRVGDLSFALPVWAAVLTVLVGTALFGIGLYWTVLRTFGSRLRVMTTAVGQVAGGRYDTRVPEQSGLREIDVLARAVNTMAGKVQGHTGELTEAVQTAVAEAQERERALVLSSRLAAIGTLAAGIAHEIHNPLGGMTNAVNRLLQDKDLSERQRTYLQLVQDGLQRVARTARKVLDFSPRTVAAQPFALAQAVDGARALVEHRLNEQQVALHVELGRLPLLHGDPHEIQQVLLNLLLNALDALGSRGKGGRIDITAGTRDGRVRLVVADDGPGMDPAELPRVIDPFFSKKNHPDASGLGMFICASIVRHHGGEILLDSAPGKGFRVTIELPAAP